jgi:hypothetical protein
MAAQAQSRAKSMAAQAQSRAKSMAQKSKLGVIVWGVGLVGGVDLLVSDAV